MKTVLVFGTFDFLHIGHLRFLSGAKKAGERLVVSIARDRVVKKLKGALPIHNERERRELLEWCVIVDEVVLGDSEIGSYRVLKKVNPDVVAVGYDQKELKKNVKEYIAKEKLKISVRQIPAYKPHSRKSSLIKSI